MRGQFVFWPDSDREVVVPNNILDEGEEAFLKMIAQAHTGDVNAGANYYVGLMGDTWAEDTTLATLAGEPSNAGGYARKAVARNSTGWPTIGVVNGIWRAATLLLTWAPSGADFSVAVRRAFLCNASSGTVGKLFAVSGALPSELEMEDGSSYPMRYELYAR